MSITKPSKSRLLCYFVKLSIIKKMKYKICSYRLQDGRWGAAFMPPQPIASNGFNMTFSERTEFGEYFFTKEEADKHTYDYLTKEGVALENIEGS